MGDKRYECTILVEKPEDKGIQGKAMCRWEGINIVTCTLIARQRVAKQVLAKTDFW
jgi:hypothetical protein